MGRLGLGWDTKSMNSEQSAVRDFHRKYGVVENSRPTIVDEKTATLRKSLIGEEFSELAMAIDKCDLVEIADALGDSLYVIYGTAVSYGIDLKPIFKEIHESNMTKTGNLREDGKILKGENWQPPKIALLLATQK